MYSEPDLREYAQVDVLRWRERGVLLQYNCWSFWTYRMSLFRLDRGLGGKQTYYMPRWMVRKARESGHARFDAALAKEKERVHGR